MNAQLEVPDWDSGWFTLHLTDGTLMTRVRFVHPMMTPDGTPTALNIRGTSVFIPYHAIAYYEAHAS